jgi:hypothetical protein
MLQWIVIIAAVLFAAGYVLWTFLPLRQRQALLDALAARGVLKGVAARHRAQMATPGCSHCSPTTRSLHQTAPPRAK